MAHIRNITNDGYVGLISVTSPIVGTLYVKNTATFSAIEENPTIIRKLANVRCSATNIGRETTVSPYMNVTQLEIGYRELFKVGRLDVKLGTSNMFEPVDNWITIKMKAPQVASAVFPIIKVRLLASIGIGTANWSSGGGINGGWFKVYPINGSFVQQIELRMPYVSVNSTTVNAATTYHECARASNNHLIFYNLLDALNVADKCYFNAIQSCTEGGIESAVFKIDYLKIKELTDASSTPAVDLAKYDYGSNIRIEVIQDPQDPMLVFPSNSVVLDTPDYGGEVHTFLEGGVLNNEYNHVLFPCSNPTGTSSYDKLPVEKISVDNYSRFYEFVLKIKDQNGGYGLTYDVANGQVSNIVFSITKILELDGINDLAQMAEVSGLKCTNSSIVAGLSDTEIRTLGLIKEEGDSVSPISRVDIEIKIGSTGFFSHDDMSLKGAVGTYWLPSWDSAGQQQNSRSFSVAELRATEKYHRFIYIPFALQESGALPVGSNPNYYPAPLYEFPTSSEPNGTWYYLGASAKNEFQVEVGGYGVTFSIWAGFSSAIIPFMVATENTLGISDWNYLRDVMVKQHIRNRLDVKVTS